MGNFIKSNSCLLAIDSSPAFSTGERLGLYFVSLLQDFELSISPPRTQTRQIGSQCYGADSVNFSPDVIANMSYLSRQDFGIENLLGAIFRPSGNNFPVFSGVRDHSFNAYLFTSDEPAIDLVRKIQGSQTFSGVTAVGLGNCYLTNLGMSFAANSLPRNSCSVIASNIVSEVLSGNYWQIPAINLQSGTTGGAATIFLNPLQVDRIPTGNVTGIIPNTWSARFQPTFENLQIPHNQLSNFAEAGISSLDLVLSIDRENAYGFGSDHVYDRDIKYPVQGSLSINGVISDYRSGSFADLMQNERKYNIQIFNRDPQDEYLSGLSLAEFTGINESGHIVNNRWLNFTNCVLREKRDSVALNGLFQFSNQWDFAADEFGGFTFKQGETTSLDSFNLFSSDYHKFVGSDGEAIIADPFVRFYEDDCSVATLLSRDGLILLTRDNFCFDYQVPSCSVAPAIYWTGICAYIESEAFGITGSYSMSGDATLVNWNNTDEQINYPVVAKITGTLGNGLSLETGYFYNLGFKGGTGALQDIPEDPDALYTYRIDRHRFGYSGGMITNFQENYYPARGSFSSPQITGLSWRKYSSPTVADQIHILAATGGAEVIEMHWRTGANGWNLSNGGSTSFANMLKFPPATNGAFGEARTGVVHVKQFFIGTGAPPWEANFFEYYPVGYRGTGMLSGSLTGAVRDCASGLAFDEGAITFNEEGTLRWNCFNSGAGIPTGWNIYRFMSGVGSSSKIGSSSTRVYTDTTMVNPGVYGFYVSSLISGYESATGTCEIEYIEAF